MPVARAEISEILKELRVIPNNGGSCQQLLRRIALAFSVTDSVNTRIWRSRWQQNDADSDLHFTMDDRHGHFSSDMRQTNASGNKSLQGTKRQHEHV